jgi:hypothetical protein
MGLPKRAVTDTRSSAIHANDDRLQLIGAIEQPPAV